MLTDENQILHFCRYRWCLFDLKDTDENGFFEICRYLIMWNLSEGTDKKWFFSFVGISNLPISILTPTKSWNFIFVGYFWCRHTDEILKFHFCRFSIDKSLFWILAEPGAEHHSTWRLCRHLPWNIWLFAVRLPYYLETVSSYKGLYNGRYCSNYAACLSRKIKILQM